MTSKKVFLSGSRKEWSSKRRTFGERGSLEHIKGQQEVKLILPPSLLTLLRSTFIFSRFPSQTEGVPEWKWENEGR